MFTKPFSAVPAPYPSMCCVKRSSSSSQRSISFQNPNQQQNAHADGCSTDDAQNPHVSIGRGVASLRYSFPVPFLLLLHDSVSGIHQSAYEVPKQAFRISNPSSVLERMECQNSVIRVDPNRLFFCFHSPKFLSIPAKEMPLSVII